jgi:transposase
MNKNSEDITRKLELPSTVENCHKIIFELFGENKKLVNENINLKERLNNNSSNSSIPPSKSFKKKRKTNQRVK